MIELMRDILDAFSDYWQRRHRAVVYSGTESGPRYKVGEVVLLQDKTFVRIVGFDYCPDFGITVRYVTVWKARLNCGLSYIKKLDYMERKRS